MEGDAKKDDDPNDYTDISIHSLTWRETNPIGVAPTEAVRFQSTPSAWRETVNTFNYFIDTVISIHSLRMEGDGISCFDMSFILIFQSTPSAWRETISRKSTHSSL